MATDQKKRIAVVGMGPVGMILAVHLKEAGCEVAVCDLDKIKMNLVRSGGVTLEGLISKKVFFSQVFTSISAITEFIPDLIIVALKATQLASAAAEIGKLEKTSAGVICAMNGIDVEHIVASVIGENRTFRMVINFAGNLNAPNITRVTFFNPPNYIASMDDSRSEEAVQVSRLLSDHSLQTKAITSFELLRRIWEKTILNASLSSLCAVGRLTIREAMEQPDTVDIVEQTIEEAIEVAEAEKIRFEDDFIRKCLRYLRSTGDHFPSLAVDLLNNRPTEIDYMNGKIVEYGRKHYIRTSLNLALTNIVKAVSLKNQASVLKETRKSMKENSVELLKVAGGKSAGENRAHFLGVDLGSAYTKFTVIDREGNPVYQTAIKTLNRDKISVSHVLNTLYAEYPIHYSCATGYGRKHFPSADIAKTELNCAAAGVSRFYPGAKNIIDIGGEDIKVIKCKPEDSIENFYLNDKCAAGTGSFITEVAEKASLRIQEMSDLAKKSSFQKELNSFCTVFAKTEIMSWLFEGLPLEDIARGIYLSIVNRVMKLRVDPALPVYLAGGVIAHHPYLRDLLQEKYKMEVVITDCPQHIVSLGAAVYAMEHYTKSKNAGETGTIHHPKISAG